MPIVSVIMPAFNAAAYIHVAIRSVLQQTVRDLELIVVDDGSRDDTAGVVARFAAADRRVRLATQANAGPGPARNTAFRASSGRYIAFLDSDDEWAPAFLARQLAVLERRPDVAVVFGNAWNRGGPRDGQPARSRATDDRVIGLADLLADENLHFIMAVFRREVMTVTGGFDPGFLTSEEYEMWLRAALSGFAFVRNGEPLGWYACRPDSLSASEERMLEGALRVLDHTRPLLAARPHERALLDRQAAAWATELAAVRARESLARGDGPAAARYLAELHARRGGWRLAVAARLPHIAIAAYRVRARIRKAGRMLTSRRHDSNGRQTAAASTA
jgi:glycosyltransferase involved in cell wall biosynthesis